MVPVIFWKAITLSTLGECTSVMYAECSSPVECQNLPIVFQRIGHFVTAPSYQHGSHARPWWYYHCNRQNYHTVVEVTRERQLQSQWALFTSQPSYF